MKDNPERNRQRAKEWYENNRERARATRRAYYLANKEKNIEQSRQWREANRERHQLNQRRHMLMKKYGITLEDYDAMLEKQNGVCAICLSEPKLGRKHLDVDHCHDTGKVRGLLCRPCNQAIGQLEHKIDAVQRAADYLKGELI